MGRTTVEMKDKQLGDQKVVTMATKVYSMAAKMVQGSGKGSAVAMARRKVDYLVVKSEENMAATMAALTVVTQAVKKVRIWAAAKALKKVNSKVQGPAAKKDEHLVG